jgi:sortase (surface protein transpeptidase)
MSHKYTYDTSNLKRRKRRTRRVVLISLVMIFGGVLATERNLYLSPSHQLTQVIIPDKTAIANKVNTNYSLPIQLQIPKLQVDTHVIYEGLTRDGHMSLPQNVTDAGWYKYGALPGNIGTAVIAGHVDGFHGRPGVFSNLNKLAPGDTAKVTESNGLTITFVVREMRNYPQAEQPAEVFNSSSGSHLNLITCTGSWDSVEHRYSERLVVFMEKAS